ncbi:MAG: hypothetical protein IKC83_04990 [Clostridia bacterium]|nr:hypothetical protein [Clostridia bacterium]
MPTYTELDKLHRNIKGKVFLIKDVLAGQDEFVCLKRDVECKVKKAYKLCLSESKLGLRATYYVQHSLLKKEKNVAYLKKMQALGADICYHHDVMDANGGDVEKALLDFENKLNDFSSSGFCTATVCQHGNPIANRVGYTSNRDFFRNENVCKKYPEIVDVVVNMSQKTGTYTYISDHRYKWKEILDPEKDDSESKELENLSQVIAMTNEKKRVIISVHTHRLNANKFTEKLSSIKFNFIRRTARLLMRIPFLKKFMARHYYLARKV